MERHLRKHRDVLEIRLKSAKSPESFMVELCSLLENTIESCKTGNALPKVTEDSALYSQLIAEVEEIGWDRQVLT